MTDGCTLSFARVYGFCVRRGERLGVRPDFHINPEAIRIKKIKLSLYNTRGITVDVITDES